MHLENKLTTYSQKAEEKGMGVEKERENGRPMQIDKEFHTGVFEVQKQMSTTNKYLPWVLVTYLYKD